MAEKSKDKMESRTGTRKPKASEGSERTVGSPFPVEQNVQAAEFGAEHPESLPGPHAPEETADDK
jgi:hypothetical protein